MRSSVSRATILAAVLFATLPADASPSTSYTTNPSNPVIVNGVNDIGAAASWEAHAHCRGEIQTTVMGMTTVKWYQFATHDNTVCDALGSTGHQSGINVKAVSGVGNPRTVTFWYATRVMRGSAVDQTSTILQWTLDNTNEQSVVYNNSNTGYTILLNNIVFQVGTWQGDQAPFQLSASTAPL